MGGWGVGGWGSGSPWLQAGDAPSGLERASLSSVATEPSSQSAVVTVGARNDANAARRSSSAEEEPFIRSRPRLKNLLSSLFRAIQRHAPVPLLVLSSCPSLQRSYHTLQSIFEGGRSPREADAIATTPAPSAVKPTSQGRR